MIEINSPTPVDFTEREQYTTINGKYGIKSVNSSKNKKALKYATLTQIRDINTEK